MGQDDIELRASISFETDQAKAAAAQKAVQGIKSGAEGAAASLGKVKPAEGTAKEFTKVQGSAEKSFAAIDSARQVTEGGIMGLGQAVKNLAGQFPALTAALGPVGLALAAFSAWKKVIDDVKEAYSRMKESLRQIGLSNIDAQIKRTVEAYNDQCAAIDRVASARQRLADIEQAKDDASLRARLAELELAQAQEKAMLSPDDTIGARKVDLSYAQKRADIEEAASRRKSERDTTQIAASLGDEIAKMKEAESTRDDLIKQYARLSQQHSSTITNARSESGKWWSFAARDEKVWTGAATETKDLATRMAAVYEAIKKADADSASAAARKTELRGMRDVAETDRQTLGTRENKRKVDDWLTGSGIDRDQNAQIDGLFQDLNAASADGSAVFRNWARQQIAAKERENALTAEFMQQMISLAEANAKQIQDSAARARRLN